MDYIDKIRELQKAEGSEPCFRTGRKNCADRIRCCWAEICEMVRLHVFNVKE